MGQRHEYGAFLGGGYYIGDLNPRRHFADVTSPAFGLVYLYNLNPRYSLRATGTYSTMKATDRLTGIGLNVFRNLEYRAQLIDVSGQIVFNFMEFDKSMTAKPYTPYLFCGLSIFNVQPEVNSMDFVEGTAFPQESYETSLTSVAFPFGFGFKGIVGSFTIGLEWSMRKTFTDKVDGLDNQYTTGNTYEDPIFATYPIGFQKGNLSNKDWYSYAGIVITYRPRPSKNACWGAN